ncbi:putative peptidase M8, partial [Trypanosoma theileri]
ITREGMRRLFLFAPLLLLYCTLVTLAVTEHHRCMHDTVALRVGVGPIFEYDKEIEKKRESQQIRLSSNSQRSPAGREEPVGEEWKPIRIKLVTDGLKKTGHDCTGKETNNITTLLKEDFTCTENDILTAEKKKILVEEILPEAIKLHKERLFVQPLNGSIVVPQFSKSNGLCSQFIPTTVESTAISDYDMVLYVAATPTPEGTFAWAATCATLGRNGRPVIGIINYGPRYIVATPQRVRVAAHEIAHALGFNLPEMERKGMGPKWYNGYLRFDVQHVNSLNVLRETKNHYNCNSAKGMEIQKGLFFVRKKEISTTGVLATNTIVAQTVSLENPLRSSLLSAVQAEYNDEEHSLEGAQPHVGENHLRNADTHSVSEITSDSSDLRGNRRSYLLKSATKASNIAGLTTSSSKEVNERIDKVKKRRLPPRYVITLASSHWSRRNAKDELMVGLVGAGYYTALTLGAFADLGYYKVNWTMAEQMSWGNNSGCEFLDNKCVNSGESNFSNMFCTTERAATPESLQCTSDRQSLGSCSIIGAKKENLSGEFQYFSDTTRIGSEESEQMDYCPFILAKPGYSCINGEQRTKMPGSVIANNSRCVEGKGLTANNNAAVGAVCVEVSCKFNKVIVRYSGNKEWYSCPEGKNLTVNGDLLKGEIVCPKYADVCNTINKTLDESQGPATDPDTVEEVQTSLPEATEATGTPKPSENAGNQGVSVPVVQNDASTTKSKPSETKEENITSSVSGQNNNAAAKKGTDGSFKASVFASVMFVFLTLSMIMLP